MIRASDLKLSEGGIRERISKITIPLHATIRQALTAIDAGGLGLALICDSESGIFRGLITDGDIRRALLSGFGLESSITHISRPEPRICSVGTPLEQLASLFSDPIRVVPMLDNRECVVDLAILDKRVHLPVTSPVLGERELQYVTECILTGWVSSTGKFVGQFEEAFAAFCGTKYAIATCNGTSALHLTLVALGIGAGDEVIVPTLTFIATANAVVFTGAKPVFVDSEPVTWNMDPMRVEEAIGPRTKAIIPVHLYGHPAQMDAILDIANRHGLAVIEDAAEAHGARYKGKRVGSIGQLGVFSFFGNKVVTTGEGGMITTSSMDLDAKLRVLRDHGMDPNHKYRHSVLGYNYRLTNIQAAVGVAQMEKIQHLLAAKRRIAKLYSEQLAGVLGVHLPPEEPDATNIYWLYSIWIDDDFGMTRDGLINYLRRADVDTRPFFPPIHQQPIYLTGQNLPVAEKLSARGLNLPSMVGLSNSDIERVTSLVRAANKHA